MFIDDEFDGNALFPIQRDIDFITVDRHDRFALNINLKDNNFAKGTKKIDVIENVLRSDDLYVIKSINFDYCQRIAPQFERIMQLITSEGKNRLRNASISLKRAITATDLTVPFVSWLYRFSSIDVSNCGRHFGAFISKFEEVVQSFDKLCPTLTLIADGCSVDIRSCQTLLRVLNSPFCQLKNLSLRNCGLGSMSRGDDESILQYLVRNWCPLRPLIGLDISQNSFNDGGGMVRSLQYSLILPSLQSLSIESTPLSESMCIELGQLIASPRCCISQLSLADSKLGDAKFRSFVLSFFRRSRGVDVYAEAINSNFTSLDVSYCALEDFDILFVLLCPTEAENVHRASNTSIDGIVRLHSGLKRLSLVGNRPTHHSFCRFSGACATSRSLTTLDISNCGINSVCAVTLFCRLGASWQSGVRRSMAQEYLTAVDVSNKRDGVLHSLEQTLGSRYPVPILSSVSEIAQTTKDYIARLRRKTQLKLSDELATTCMLSTLKLASNCFGFRAVHLLSQILKKCTHHSLRTLVLSGNSIGEVSTNKLLSTMIDHDRRLLRLVLSRQHCIDEESLLLISEIEKQLPIDQSGTISIRMSAKLAFLSVMRRCSPQTEFEGERMSPWLLPVEAIVIIFSFLRVPVQRHIIIE